MDQMSEINLHVLSGVLMDSSKLAQVKDALLCSLKLQLIGNHLFKELAHCIEKNNGPKGLWCYDMAFQQVIIISFNLILSGGTYLIWKISSYP